MKRIFKLRTKVKAKTGWYDSHSQFTFDSMEELEIVKKKIEKQYSSIKKDYYFIIEVLRVKK